MYRPQLYVKSRRRTVITGHVSMETIGSAAHTTSEYVEGSTVSTLPHEDQYARDLLRQAGIKFDLIDLSNGIRARLTARLKGIRETPTLLDEEKHPKAYVGTDHIRQYLAKK